MLEIILDQAAEEKDESKNSDLLHLAAANGSLDVVQMLIGRSMDPDRLGQAVMVLLILLTLRAFMRR